MNAMFLIVRMLMEKYFPQQEKALETLGFELPNPEKKAGRFNNRKMVFDATCRILLFDIKSMD